MSATATAISRDELKSKMDLHEPFVLIGALPYELYERSHLPGAVNLPSDRAKQDAVKVLPDK